MEASLLIRLIDQVSGPGSKITGTIRAIGAAASGLREGFGKAIRDGFSVANIEQATKNAEHALEKARGRLLGALAMATSIGAPVVQAAQFDQSMRGLDKVLDVSAERLNTLRKFAIETSAQVPVAARDLLELMSNAAQGGVPQEELEAFSLYVAKAAVAFDMAGGEIGDRFAKLRNVYKLNQQGIEQLGDATNHLSNHMAAKANELTDFANRAAGAASLMKLTAVQTTAVGAAMIAAGIVPETAARGFSALATKVTTGGEKIDDAFESIGLNRKKWLKEMKADAPAAIEKLFRAMNQSPQGMEALVALVGMDFSDDFSKLVNNPDLLTTAFKWIADQQAYAGSTTQEAAKQAEGAVKKWQLLQNKLTALSITIGTHMLPTTLALMDAIGGVIDKVRAFADANPQLTQTLVMATAGLLAFGVASRLVGFALAGVRLPLIGLFSTFWKIDEQGKNIAIGFRVLSWTTRFLAVAFGLVQAAAGALISGLAGVTAPIWAVVAVIAAAGFAIWKYWDRVAAFVSGFASAFDGIWEAVKAGAGAAGDWLVGKIGEWLNLPAGQVDAFKAALRSAFDFSAWIESARQALSEFWSWLGSFFSQEKLSDEQKAEMFAAGQRLGESLIRGINEYVASWIAPIQDMFNFALNIQWPDPPEWLRWLMEHGGKLLDKGGDALSGGADTLSGWWKTVSDWSGKLGGGGDGGTPAPAAPAAPSGQSGSWLSGLWDSLTGATTEAGNGLADGGQRGGQALAQGGIDAANEIRAAGRDAAAYIAAGARGAAAAARSSGNGSVSSAISGSRTGALHGGTD